MIDIIVIYTCPKREGRSLDADCGKHGPYWPSYEDRKTFKSERFVSELVAAHSAWAAYDAGYNEGYSDGRGKAFRSITGL